MRYPLSDAEGAKFGGNRFGIGLRARGVWVANGSDLAEADGIVDLGFPLQLWQSIAALRPSRRV